MCASVLWRIDAQKSQPVEESNSGNTTMKSISRRIRRLEKSRAAEAQEKQLVIVACDDSWRLALDEHTCIKIIRECGFLPRGPIAILNFLEIPHGLNAEELERFLREYKPESWKSFSGKNTTPEQDPQPFLEPFLAQSA